MWLILPTKKSFADRSNENKFFLDGIGICSSNHSKFIVNICTSLQTPWDENGSTTTVEQPKHQRSASWGSPDVKEVYIKSCDYNTGIGNFIVWLNFNLNMKNKISINIYSLNFGNWLILEMHNAIQWPEILYKCNQISKWFRKI